MDAAAADDVYYAGNSTIVIAGGKSPGYSGSVNNDVWVSSDLGCNWQHYTAPWSPRWGASMVFFGSQLSLGTNGSFFGANHSLLLIGGEDVSGQDNDEGWLSFDTGVTWQLIDSTSLPEIAFFGLAVADYQLAEYGGFATSGGREYPSGFIASLPVSFLSTPTPVSSSSSSSSSTPPPPSSSASSPTATLGVSSSSSGVSSVLPPASSSTGVFSMSSSATGPASSSTARSSSAASSSSSAARTSSVLGDPQFIGLRGQSYQVHGIDGGVYSLISDPLIQLIGRFPFLSENSSHPCLLDAITQQAMYVCWSACLLALAAVCDDA